MFQILLRRLRFYLMYLGRPRWDTGVSPPELLAHIHSHPPGRALDLGCGTGTNVITLAEHGWDALGIDFIPRAVAQARRKAQQAGVQAQFQVGDVTDLSSLSAPFDLILDMGCYHNLSPQGRAAYRNNLDRLLAAGGTFLLYGFWRPDESQSLPAITPSDLDALSQRLRPTWRQEGQDRRPSDASSTPLAGPASLWLAFERP